jgi:F0F1-type ATP synthase membrane subunit a
MRIFTGTCVSPRLNQSDYWKDSDEHVKAMCGSLILTMLIMLMTFSLAHQNATTNIKKQVQRSVEAYLNRVVGPVVPSVL